MTQLRTLHALPPAQASRVRGLAAEVAAEDGVAALSEQFLLGLRDGSPARHVLADNDDRLVGYAQLADPGMPASAAELLVAPSARRRGVGTALLAALPRDVLVWCHGDLPAARGFAAARGLRTVRELHRMALRLDTAELDQPRLPSDLAVRTFQPGADEQPWVQTNAAAFASHPEQGRLTLADLRERMAQPWFDPAGFFLVVPRPHREPAGPATRGTAGPAIAAFHWTKAPPAEVYVVGVHPAYQGQGLGRAVTLLGLHHLREQGYDTVTLYTDGDNAPALAIYRSLGFVTVGLDRMVAFPADAEDATMGP
ncbi:MAG: mycothiol synthase [Dermatophilaceae bacterium]